MRELVLQAPGRLVTLTGTGGCGKTRLALQVAAELVGSFGDGVRLIELAPLADPALVARTVATAVGVRERPGWPMLDTLVAGLTPRELLLVLDNCEHLVEACAELADAVLSGCPRVHVLATSREPLHVHRELTWRVPSLTIPDPRQVQRLEALASSAAVELFVERARAVHRGFALTPQNALTVAQVCVHLEGLPLAIELAAVRVRALGVEQLRERLDDCFRLLVGGSRTAPNRQRTLEATLDWSHQLLAEPEQVAFRRLAVFVGGWSLEAAEAVCAGEPVAADDVLEVLTRLVDTSLVAMEEHDGRARYRFLEPVRQYAHRRLVDSGELLAVQRRHTSFFLAFAEHRETDANVGGPRRPAAHAALGREQDNLRAALRWCLDHGEAERGLRLGKAHTHFWLVQSAYHEGWAWLTQLLAAAGAATPTAARAAALIVAGTFATRLGKYAMARPLYAEALLIARQVGDPWLLFSTLVDLAWDAEERGDYGAAQGHLDEALATIRAAGEQVGESMALGRLGWLACRQGDYGRARARCEAGLAIARAAGDDHNVGVVLNMLGYAVLLQGEVPRARAVFEESLRLRRQEGERWGTAWALDGLGLAALEEGRHAEAAAVFAESARLRYELGDQVGSAESLESLAGLAAAQTQLERAGRLAGAAAAARDAIGAPISPLRHAVLERWLLPLRHTVGGETLERAWAAGRVLTMEQAVAEALAGAEPPPGSSARLERSPETRAGPLTRREQEVAALLAQGLSNRQIAERLVVTERTVAAHIEHILDKLGFASRHQVGAWAAEHRLLT